MNQFTRVGATGAALALATMPLLPGIAAAKAGPSKAQIEHQERVTAAANQPTKAQIEFAERTNSAATHPTKAQVEFAERSDAVTTSSSAENVQARLISDSSDAAAWQLALSFAVGAALTGGVVLASRQVTRQRHALAG